MNTEIERTSAVIYQFPLRGRAAAARAEAEVAPVVVVDGWYHAEAVRESEPARHS